MKHANATVIYELIGRPRHGEVDEWLPKEINLTHIPLHALQRIFHVGPSNLMIEGRRFVSRDKAETLQAFCSESIDYGSYDWEFRARWSDEH